MRPGTGVVYRDDDQIAVGAEGEGEEVVVWLNAIALEYVGGSDLPHLLVAGWWRRTSKRGGSGRLTVGAEVKGTA